MFNKNYKLAIYFLVTIFLTFGLTVSLQSILAAWSNPTQTPVNGNPPGPVFSQSTANQIIGGGGGLGVQGPFAAVDANFSGLLRVNSGDIRAGVFTVTSASTNVTSNLGIPLQLMNNSAVAGNYSGIVFYDANGNLQGSIGMMYGNHTAPGQGTFYIEPRILSTPQSFVVSPAGNVGIGTWTPIEKLTIDSTNAYSTFSLKRSGTVVSGNALGEIRFKGDNNSGALKSYALITGRPVNINSGAESGQIDFYTDAAGIDPPTMSMRAGNVGIGMINPTQKLDVSGVIHASGDICTSAGGGKCLSTVGTGVHTHSWHYANCHTVNNWTFDCDGAAGCSVSGGVYYA